MTGALFVADELQRHLSGADPASVTGDDLAEIRADLERAATRAVALVDGHDASGVLPLRLPKARVIALGDCERFAVARHATDLAGVDEAPSPSVLLGLALDVYVEHELVEGPVADPVDDVSSWLEARGDLDVRDGFIAGADPAALVPLASAARAWSGLDADWWPRTQAAAAVHLAGGAVRCDGRTDVELGGPLSGRPGVVVEVKVGRPHPGHLAEATHYALLVALRDRVAPALVARWYPEGSFAVMSITVDVLHSASRRLADAIGAWAEMQVGRTPRERSGPACAWCPDADRCPSYQERPSPLSDPDGTPW